SLCMLAASIRLLFLDQLDYVYMVTFLFGSVLLYFFSTTLVFHKYRHSDQRLGTSHLALLLGVLAVFIVISFITVLPSYLLVGEVMLFFALYAKVTTK
ncbi:low temperature requirement protein A, partial [Paenibacillus sp. MCAF20]